MIWLFFSFLSLHSQNAIVDNSQQSNNKKEDSLQQLLVTAKTTFNQGQYGESIKFLKKALQIIEETKDRKEEPGIYNSLGGCYCELGDISKGMESFYTALRVSEELGNKEELANAYQYIGATFDDLKDYSKALGYYNKALKLNLENGNQFKYAQNNNSIAYISMLQGNFSYALKTYRESLKIYEMPGAPEWGIPWCHACIGDVYEQLGDSAMNAGNKTAGKAFYEEALKNHLSSLEKFKELDILPGYAAQFNYVGAMNLKLNSIPEARKYFQTGLRFLIESGNKERIAETYLYLSKIDSLEGNYKNALRHFKLSTLYRDSVYNSEQSRKIALSQTQYEIEKKEDEIKLLAAENKLNNSIAARQNQQKKFAYGVIAAVLLLSVFGFYRYRRYSRLKSDQKMLRERLVISQDLHDNVGSTLSSISVFSKVAQLQSEENKKEELQEVLAKINITSGDMVAEMNDTVWAINPRNDSMEKIIQRMESFAKPLLASRNISFTLDYEPSILSVNLGMEKRKNFYLIFKEAVNNAYKYSGCSEINSGITNTGKQLELFIKDDGVGFDLKHEMQENKLTLSGNGLRNMQMRTEEMDGNLLINSSAGKGTEIRLSVPIP